MTVLTEFMALLAQRDAVLVTVRSHRGSVPREAGAWMAVFADQVLGTVGGGHLEWQASDHARGLLPTHHVPFDQRYALGPTLGQCCGGEVVLHFERVTANDTPALGQRLSAPQATWPHVALFGAGHVGRALVNVLGTLPLRAHWFDSRDHALPVVVPENVVCEQSQPLSGAVAALPARCRVLIMSFSHAEDLDVLVACLQRQRERADLAFIGLMGSRTKWASFCHRLSARGFVASELAQVHCPVGLAGITGKAPEVIAVAVAAQLLQLIDADRVAPARNSI